MSKIPDGADTPGPAPSSKAALRRVRLAERLVAAGHKRVGEGGLAALRARDLAKDVGCAVGAIYNVFEDLDALTLAVNLRTLTALNEALAPDPAGDDRAAPTARLIALAHAYCAFAARHPRHWRAVFEHRLPEGASLPEPFLEARDALFGQIVEPLSAVMPEAGEAAVTLRAHTLFAAVHGIVAWWLDGRFENADRAVVRAELEALIRAYAKGV